MIKRIICLLTAALILSSQVYADEPASLTTEIYAFVGTLYYFDTPTGNIVLKNVRPVSDSEGAKKAAEAAEYLEICTSSSGRFFSDGTYVQAEWVNEYADGQIWFVMACNADGNLAIPYFKIMV